MSNVFERIKHVAQIRGMNLREVAKKAGFKSETGIYRYNQGLNAYVEGEENESSNISRRIWNTNFRGICF